LYRPLVKIDSSGINFCFDGTDLFDTNSDSSKSELPVIAKIIISEVSYEVLRENITNVKIFIEDPQRTSFHFGGSKKKNASSPAPI
jgi:phenylpyruvate tautomerase PptA (4-oxalocrotonate tautomerase family)